MLRLIAIIRMCLVYRIDILLPPGYHKPMVTRLVWLLRNSLAPFASHRYCHLSPQQRLRQLLVELGPMFVKFGQLLSTRVDLLEQATIDELSQLQDKVPPFPNQQARQIIERELGQPLNQLYCQFDDDILASASIAQVYGARLHDGQQVVVKVVRPGIERVISKDIRLMHRLARLIERTWPKARKLHLPALVRNYHQTIIGELDMEREAASCSQLRRNFTNSRLLYVPGVYWKLCSKNVLTQERIDGIAVNNTAAMDALGINRELLAAKGVEIFFTQVFDHSFFHADMHPGNIFVMKDSPDDPRYVGVDFGIMGSLSDDDQYYLALNLLAFFNRDYRRVAQLHVETGWVSADTRVEELESAVRTVCEPIFSLPLKEISFGKIITRLFQAARQFDMEVQPQLLLLQKTLFHIEGLGRQLYPDLDLWATAKPFLERWVRRRAGYRRLVERLRQQVPDWVEVLPVLPRLIETTQLQLQQLPGQLARQERQLYALRRTQRCGNWIVALGCTIALAVGITVALVQLGLVHL